MLELLDGYACRRSTRVARRGWRPARCGRALAGGAARARGRAAPQGRRHSRERDRRAVSHHYDVSNEFFGLVLGESMTYSCAIFSRGAQTLEAAQRAKLELVCTKLGLRTGERVLDVGCGWGSFALHAAGEHGAHVTAITLSEPQAALARERAAAAGLADRIEIHRRLPRPWRRAVRRDRLDRHGRARRQREHRRLRAAARHDAAPRRAAAQPRHRAASLRRPRGRTVLRALRVPRRGTAAPLAGAHCARGRRP